MKYIIMCGGKYEQWKTPKHLMKVNGEVLVERTIRLLKENGIKDISISTSNPVFEYLGLPLLKHNNSYEYKDGKLHGYWCDAFYPTNEPTCYIFGDVYFSDEAIKKIVETKTDDMDFFGSSKPYAKNYPKNHEEPFALKVVNTEHLKEAIQKTKKLDDEGKFWRKPIMWELWTVIKNAPLQVKIDEYTCDYTIINDYTSDIDNEQDVAKLEKYLEGGKMVKVEVIEEFTLGKFDELKNIVRAREDKNEEGRLYIKDTFVCDNIMADYLTGDNKYKKPYVKVIEIIPEKKSIEVIEEKVEEKPIEVKKNKKRKK